jgi:hypothetical protein
LLWAAQEAHLFWVVAARAVTVQLLVLRAALMAAAVVVVA